MHANHASISIQGRSPISSCSWVHFEHCIHNVVACNVLGWTLHTINYGMVFNTSHNVYIAPWRKCCIEDGTCGDVCPKPTPFPAHMSWSGLGKCCHHMWRLEDIGQKNPLGPCVGWANLYSHSNCKWLGQSMLLFPLPCLGRSSWNNSSTLG